MTFDLMKPWPFENESISAVHANHVLEHLPDPLFFMQEAWRVLAPSQTSLKSPNLHIRVPYGPSEYGVGDITHIRYFSPTTWACWAPGYEKMTGNPQHQNRPLFGALMVAMRVGREMRLLVKKPWRKYGLKVLPHLWGGYAEMHVKMMKLTEAQVPWWLTQAEAEFIPVSRIIFEDEYYNLPTPAERKFLCLD